MKKNGKKRSTLCLLLSVFLIIIVIPIKIKAQSLIINVDDTVDINRFPLNVPYYSQHTTKWCSLASASMILNYYGINVHMWDIAQELKVPKNKGLTTGTVHGYIKSTGLSVSKINQFHILQIKNDLRDYLIKVLDNNNPIYLQIPSINHAVVVTGYKEIDNNLYFYIHDPSGKLIISLNITYEYYISVPVLWTKLKTKFTFSLVWARAFYVNESPSPPLGSIDISHIEAYNEFKSLKLNFDRGIDWVSNDDHKLWMDDSDELYIVFLIHNQLKEENEYNIIVKIDVNGITKWREDINKPVKRHSSLDLDINIMLTDIFDDTKYNFLILQLWSEDERILFDEIKILLPTYPLSLKILPRVINVPLDYSTIQEAIDVANDGDTILVSKGEWVGGIVNKAIKLSGLGDTVIIDGPAYPMLPGEPPDIYHMGFFITPEGSGSTISNFVFKGGSIGETGNYLFFAVFARSGVDYVTVEYNTIYDCGQCITNRDGDYWKITQNIITGYSTAIGKVSGVFLGSSIAGYSSKGNYVAHNQIYAEVPEGSLYSSSGIVMTALGLSASEVSYNKIMYNKILILGPSSCSIYLAVEGLDDPPTTEQISGAKSVFHDNIISYNELWGSENTIKLKPQQLDEVNNFK